MASVKTAPVSLLNETANGFAAWMNIPTTNTSVANETAIMLGGYGRGDILLGDLNLIQTSTQAEQPIYRGRVGGEYIYNVGSAPVGATDIVIIGYT